MTADFSDLRVMERVSQLQPGGGTSKYFRHPTERQNNRSTHGHTRPSVLSCQSKSNQIHSEMHLLPLWGDYSWYYNNNAGIECVRRPFSAILCFTVLLLTYSATTDQAKQENAFQLMEAELKSLFMKECIVHFNRTMWRASPGVLFLLHLLLIYMCDFLEKKKKKTKTPFPPGVISNLHSCFLIIPTEISQSNFFLLIMWQPADVPQCLSPGFSTYFSLCSLNEHGLQGSVHAKCLIASKLIRNRKACRASG